MNRNDLPAPNAECEVCGRKYRKCKKCLQMKTMGIETWRDHCDSYECYQVYILATTTDYNKITKEEYDRIVNLELPEERKPVHDIQEKLDRIKEHLDANEVRKQDQNVSNNSSGFAFKNQKNYKQFGSKNVK